jgi:hypothetical protein
MTIGILKKPLLLIIGNYALFKMVRYVLLRPLRPELDISWSNFLVLPF